MIVVLKRGKQSRARQKHERYQHEAKVDAIAQALELAANASKPLQFGQKNIGLGDNLFLSCRAEIGHCNRGKYLTLCTRRHSLHLLA